jgi:hypothetical protein
MNVLFVCSFICLFTFQLYVYILYNTLTLFIFFFLFRYISDILSDAFIHVCPHCQLPALKASGCSMKNNYYFFFFFFFLYPFFYFIIFSSSSLDRVPCVRCKHNFCNICLSKLSDDTPYDHFGTGKPCPLWDTPQSVCRYFY